MLPIEGVIPEFLDALRSSRAVVLTAPPGAGKTTGIPPAILDSNLFPEGQIVVLQPRRMAARAAAARMAGELGERVGRTVGYKIRFDEKASKDTRILVVTEGILTRRFLSDPLLEGVACVILDEFHERSVHVDLALAFCRELQDVRDDLRLVVMSATLQTGPIADYLGNCPVVSGGERPFDVDIEHAKLPDQSRLYEKTAAAVRRVLRQQETGDILVFLPGAGEIRRTQEALRGFRSSDPEVLPLYGALPAKEQDRALVPSTGRRVVLATNIAETSLTVPGVTAVIDTGWCKQMQNDPASGLDRLQLIRISKNSAAQRAGRAGRTAPGRVLRLWTQHEHQALPEADQPEIKRVDLAPHLLSVLAFHPGNPREFPFFQPPKPAVLESSIALLSMLGALDTGSFKLTEKGRRLASIPAHPRVGALLLRAAGQGLAKEGALLAALLSERDILKDPAENTDSDLLYRMERFEELEESGFNARSGIHLGAVLAVKSARDQLSRIARSMQKKKTRATENRLLSLLLPAFPDRVCRRRAPDSDEAVMVGGRGVRLAKESGVREANLFIAIEADAGKRGLHSKALVRKASAVSVKMLEELFPDLVKIEEGAVFDEKKKAVVGVRRKTYRDLALEERTGVRVDPEMISAVLSREAAARFEQFYKPDKPAVQFRARLLFLNRILPKESWPDVSDEGLKTWLPDLCAGKSRFSDLSRIDWLKEINARLSYKLQKLLDKEAPEKIQVPSGSQIRLDYVPALEPESSPVLAVKLQEVFGLKDTPRIARGRVPVLMHLLAPNRRPVQVTTDLKNFWNQTYQEVRKELRARYPKHPWPEDPWSAPPKKGTKRRKR